LNDEVLDRNLTALLTRALPDDAPSESFRRRVALTVAARLPAAVDSTAVHSTAVHSTAVDPAGARPSASVTPPRRTARPAVLSGGHSWAVVGALAAAALLLFVFHGALFEGRPGRPAEGPRATPHGTDGRWIAQGSGGGPLGPDALLGTLATALAHASAPAGLTWSTFPAGVAAFAVQVAAATARAQAGVGVAAGTVTHPDAAQRIPLGSDADDSLTADGKAATGPALEGASLARPGPGSPSLWVEVVTRDNGAPLARFRAWVKREVFVPEVATPTFTELNAPHGAAALPASDRWTQTLVIEAAGYAPWRATGLSVNTPDTPVVVALERGVALVGSVLDAATSAPVAGALVLIESALPHDVVEVHARDLEPLPLHAVTTDAAGAFRIAHAPRAEVVLRASHPDFAPEWSVTLDLAGTAADAPGAIVVPAIALGSGGTVVGRVEQTDGSPFEGTEVVLSMMTNRAVVASAASGTSRAGVKTYGAATTDSDGVYRIEHLPAGQFIALHFGDVSAGASMPRMRQAVVTHGATARVDFLVDGAHGATDRAGLVGHLRDADLTPCAEVDLSLYEVHGGAWRAARTDAAGRYEFLDVPPGLWAICRATRGFEDQQVLRHIEVSPDSRGTREVDVTLPRGALTFVVQQGDGRPVTSGRLALKREVAPNSFEFHAVLTLHASGRTRIEGLPDGRYRATLVGDTPGLGHIQVGPLTLHREVEVSEHCTLPRGGALLLSVRNELGGPAPAYVLVVDAAGNELLLGLDSRTDAGGVRRIPCLAPGSYTLEVRAFDGRSRSVRCETREGDVTELTVELPPR